MVMSRQIGLKDVSFAPLTKDDTTAATYGTVKKYERSISAKITPKSSSENEYSDDTIEDVVTQFDSVDVEIELNQLSLATRAFLQGAKLVNGVLIESKDDIPPYVYMAFKSKKANGKYRYVALFKGKFELPTDNFETQADKIKTQTATIKGTFMAREFDGNWRLIGDEDVDGANSSLSEWLTTVPTIPVSTTP
jgi:phi13 family phage major tail protein